HAAEPSSRMRRRADVVEAIDDGPVIAAPWKRPPQKELAERAGPRGAIALVVFIVGLRYGWSLEGSTRGGEARSRQAAPLHDTTGATGPAPDRTTLHQR